MAVTQALTMTEFLLRMRGKYAETNDFGTEFPANFFDDWVFALASGAGSGNANFWYRNQFTINATLTQTLNLRSLTDEFQNTVAMTFLKGLAIRLKSSADAAATIDVGGTGSGNNFTAIFKDPTDKMLIKVGGVRLVADVGTGYTVDATHRNIDIVNNSATQPVVVDVRAWGEK